MEAVDVIILLLLGIGAYEGYKKGLLMSLIGFFGFILALVLGIYFMDFAGDWLATKTNQEALSLPIVSFLLIFIATMLAVHVLGKSLKKVLGFVLLGGLDSFGGAILGVVRTGFFISLLIWIVSMLELESLQKWQSTSEYLLFFEPFTPVVLELLDPILPAIKDASKELIQKIEG